MPGNLDNKAYDTVAKLEENALRNLLEEVISQTQSKNDKSPIAQFLIRKEEDALREESGSGEDTIELSLGKQKKRRSIYKRDNCDDSSLDSSAATRNNTGGSLGSLHNLSDPKATEPTNNNVQGVAARSRAGGSCGNLSKSSFETHAGKRRNRRSKELHRASTSQREGGSLQNLSKAEAASHESKKLHKSGSLSQVFSDIGGARIKIRRQKTSSESSGRTQCRRSEEREVGDSSDEDAAGEYPYQRLVPSSHSSVSGHSGDPVESSVLGMVVGHWNEDHMSDVASGETTEEDGESMHISARAKLSDSSSRHIHNHNSDSSDTELHSVISHTSHRDVLPTISSDSEVDKPIKFSLSKVQDAGMSTLPTTGLSYTAPCVNSIFDGQNTTKASEPDIGEKRKLRSTKSESGTVEKSSLDENGNPVLMSVRSSGSGNGCASTNSVPPLQTSSCNDRHSSSTLSLGRRNGFSAQTKDISMYSRLKAKQDKKKAIKEKDVMPSEKTPGFRGDAPLDAILKYLGADDSSSSKPKKKNKGKKEEVREEREGSGGTKSGKGRTKALDKTSPDDADGDRQKMEPPFPCDDPHLEGRGGGGESASSVCYSRKGDDGEVHLRGDRKGDEDGRRSGKRVSKESEKRRNKKGSGALRETSSVEDLVSKSKQSDCADGMRKQITLDDGDVSLSGIMPFQAFSDPERHGNVISAAPVPDSSLGGIKSEFSYDFYKVGDALLEAEPAVVGSGDDFEVVSRKKGKRARNSTPASFPPASKGTAPSGWANSGVTCNHNSSISTSSQSVNSGQIHSVNVSEAGSGSFSNFSLEDQRRCASFPRPQVSSSPAYKAPTSSSEIGPDRPARINFNEGPFTVHDGAFLSQFSGANRSSIASERYAATTSAPHSEDSDSDGGDSVHSMPAHSITPRPENVRKPPPSTDSTPQASYANIAKLAASTNKAQMKRVAMANHFVCGSIQFPPTEDDSAKSGSSLTDLVELPPKDGSVASILENDNFPPLGVGVNSPPLMAGANTSNCVNYCHIDENTTNIGEVRKSSECISKSLDMSTPSTATKDMKYPKSISASDVSHVNDSVYSKSSITCSSNGPVITTKSSPSLSTSVTPTSNPSAISQVYTVLQHSSSPTYHSENTAATFAKPTVPQSQSYHTSSSTITSSHIPSPSVVTTQALASANRVSTGVKPASLVNSHAVFQTPQQPLSQNMANLSRESSSEKNKLPSGRETKNCTSNGNRQSKTKENNIINDGSKNRRYEAAVIFTDNAKFDLSITGIEFGFDVSLENLSNLSENALEPVSNCNTHLCSNITNNNIIISNNNNIKTDVDKHVKSYDTIKGNISNTDSSENLKNLQSIKKDFSKFYQPPENDAISYNYEELCKHVYKAWESTLRMLEEDPKNIQYWKAPSS